MVMPILDTELKELFPNLPSSEYYLALGKARQEERQRAVENRF